MQYSIYFNDNEIQATKNGTREIVSYREVLEFAGSTQDDMAEQGKCTSDDELQAESELAYLLEKERVCGLDKAERYELEQLLSEEV